MQCNVMSFAAPCGIEGRIRIAVAVDAEAELT